IQQFFQYGKSLGIRLDYIVQPKELGIGHAVSLAENVVGDDEHFLLVYGDALMAGNPYTHLLNRFKRSKPCTLATITHPSSEGSYGNIYLSHNMKITKLLEKPTGTRLSNYIFGGSFILSRDCFKKLRELNKEIVLLFQHLIDSGDIEASLWEDNWIDISRPWFILAANRLMIEPWNRSMIPASVNIESNVNISGVVKMEENVHISSGTKIVGPCYIGSNVYIGNNCLIRKNSSIGPNSKIGYGTEIKNTVLFGNSTIGRLSFLGDSVIGENVNLGSGIMTVNYDPEGHDILLRPPGSKPINTKMPKLGVLIGDNSTIGTGNTIAPGTIIPPETKIADKISINDEIIKTLNSNQ
ncbi:MAG: sugar phosphate nucleotidyltransferase, partial [Deltaproteobacteria bacterium]|nr:sugar phosphate nucleotidyltransferase [Deltaproteobacteria bacterium]